MLATLRGAGCGDGALCSQSIKIRDRNARRLLAHHTLSELDNSVIRHDLKVRNGPYGLSAESALAKSQAAVSKHAALPGDTSHQFASSAVAILPVRLKWERNRNRFL